LVCGCCGKLIRGKYYSHTFIDGYFCESCEKDNTKCSVCSRPISGEPTMIGGKRPLCKICMKTVLLDKDDYRKVYDDSVKMLSKLLGEEVYHEVSLDVVDDISKVREKAGFESDGKELGLFKRKDNDFGIYILYRATRELAYETIPHEWAHAWFAENGHQLHLQWVEEGFCQWVASKILAEKKYKRGLGILENRKDLYGKGYRYISMIERQGGGIDAVLDFVKSEPPADLRREKK
ncbi:MAG: protein DA1, partial [Planctomycetes bacterium]|nr:protein DA1 [Planctomycetota bacterium]